MWAIWDKRILDVPGTLFQRNRLNSVVLSTLHRFSYSPTFPNIFLIHSNHSDDEMTFFNKLDSLLLCSALKNRLEPKRNLFHAESSAERRKQQTHCRKINLHRHYESFLREKRSLSFVFSHSEARAKRQTCNETKTKGSRISSGGETRTSFSRWLSDRSSSFARW